MRIERTKNASRNIVFGIALKVYQIIVPFLMRTAIIYLLGVEYLGLNSLFTSVLQVLNLAELGVGSAMVYSMYKPIVDDNTEEICALMQLYKVYYRVIGIVIATVGMVIVPFIPKLISGDIPADMNVYVLYLMNLAATVLSYWLFAYKGSILQAYQRTDVTSKVLLLTETVKYIAQLAVLAIFHNYYYFVIVILLTQILTNIITAVYADRMYPEYKARGKLPKEIVKQINKRIKDLFTARLGSVVVGSADTIVISAFLGLTILAIYQNYFYLITAVIGLVNIVFVACTAGIGNSLIVETDEKNFNDLKKFTFIISWIAGFCSACFLCLFQPFMEIWVGDELMVTISVVICFCIYYYVYEINQLLNLYKDAAGIWHEDRFRPLVTAIVNLILNLATVKFLGLYGIILSTVISMIFVGMPWLLHNLFTVLFDRKKLMPYVLMILKYVVIAIAASVLTYLLCSAIPLQRIPLLITRVIICCIVPNMIFLIVYRKHKEFKESVELLNAMTKGRLHLDKVLDFIL